MSFVVHPRTLNVTAGILAGVTLITLVTLWPTGRGRPVAPALSSFEGVYTATIERAVPAPCAGVDDGSLECTAATIRLLEGPAAGSSTTIELSNQNRRTATLAVGDRIVVGHQPDVAGFEYVVLDRDRRPTLLLLGAIFVAAVVALGRARGLSALIGLASTIGLLFLFVVPSILEGRDPLLVSMVGATAIAFAALYLSHGVSTRTTIALLGTIGGLAMAAILAVAFMGLAEITGLASEEALVVAAVGTEIDLRGLILGGILIGALGAIDDMTVTQVSAIWELRASRAAAQPSHLLRAGLRIGRDHVASTVNTLVLAYAGASMPLLILFVLSDQPASIVANGELVATEIVRTLVGSIGLVASVPITTLLAAHASRTRPRPTQRQDTSTRRPPAVAGPEEHPIPDRRLDPWLRRRRIGRDVD